MFRVSWISSGRPEVGCINCSLFQFHLKISLVLLLLNINSHLKATASLLLQLNPLLKRCLWGYLLIELLCLKNNYHEQKFSIAFFPPKGLTLIMMLLKLWFVSCWTCLVPPFLTLIFFYMTTEINSCLPLMIMNVKFLKWNINARFQDSEGK